jgi:hypothetical protein
MATRQDVVDFLNLLKGAVMLGNLHVRNREKNTQGLLDLGISADERKDVILGLVPEDYMAGPKPDDTDLAKEVWEFGKNVEGTEVYIKLRVVQDTRRRHVYHATVWSFHPAEYPMQYPLRGGGK